MNAMYEKGCDSCVDELIKEPVSFNDFKERCPRIMREQEAFRRYGRIASRGYTCALKQIEATNTTQDT